MARVSDIFLSYDSFDRSVAHIFADALEARGWSVWWDREIPLGKRFDEVIELRGSSGGAILNARGQVVGINVAGGENEGRTFGLCGPLTALRAKLTDGLN